jgi:DNA-binding response OmpR family regulator
MTGNEAGPTTLRVLLVEDHADTAGSLALLLRRHGHEVEVAPDGPTALRMAADRPPDVALLDLGLPGGMDGCDVARGLWEQAADKIPLLIAVTGRGGEVDRCRSAEAGIHLYLRKPVDSEALERLLERFKATLVG